MPERRLVEQQQRAAGQQRAADRQHLLLAAGQRAAALVQALLQAREQGEDLLDVLRRTSAPLAGHRTHLQVLEHGHAREDAPALGRLADAEIDDVVGGEPGDVAALVDDPARAPPCGLPQMVISRVDLPAPLAPMMVTISPCSTSTLTPFSASMLP